MDSKSVEEHRNAYQMMFNLLLSSLAAYSPEVIDSWCDLVEDVLKHEDKIPLVTRAIMERTALAYRATLAGKGDARGH